jgi:hypothetical protein
MWLPCPKILALGVTMGQTALAHSVYLRREEARATPQQLFTMKKENIRVDGVYYMYS